MTDSANEQPESFDLNSDDVAARKLADLKRLFPEVFNEDKIDFDQLRRVMGDWVDEGSERFGLTWPGKAACMRVIQAPATGALRPDRDESVNFDESENVFIEGDNLEVLKLLQKAYFGKIKMIYIDPPYNTGAEFIYPDKYAENLDTYLAYTRQIDAEGKRFSTNPDSAGRFHSRWLNMMFPRLYLAKNLLTEDGVIFVSIGDDEQTNLRKVLDSIFGEENFIATIARQQKSGGAKAKFFTPNLDYIHVYAKNIQNTEPFRARLNEDQIKNYYKFTFEGGKNDGRVYGEERLYKASLEERPNQRYWIECPDGSFAIPPGDTFPNEVSDGSQILPDAGDGVWKWTYARYAAEKAAGHIIFKPSDQSPLVDKDRQQSKWNIYNILWLDEQQEKGAAPSNILTQFENRQSAQELEKLGIPFSYAKPTSLIEYLFEISKLNQGDLVLDFFAGSGTFAHAALKFQNKAEVHLKTISVQLPEPTEPESAERKAGFDNLAQIARERLRRAIKSENADSAGFRAFRLSSSSFEGWEASTEDGEQDLITKLEAYAKNVGDALDDDLFFELLLKDGFELTTAFETQSIAGSTVYSVADGALLICLGRNLTKEIIDALADLAEEKDAARVVCLDTGFNGNDQLKTNAVQTFKSRLGHGEDGSMFRTV